MPLPLPGQRWISRSEPELGLGIVRSADNQRVTIRFPAVGETRSYALESAPLVRAVFEVGDEIAGHNGHRFIVETITIQNGLHIYRGGESELAESELLDSLWVVRPDQRLLTGITDHPREFDLRLETHGWNTRIRRSPVRGFVGSRIQLIPHQLAIVAEAARRLFPRVLLADEVGLGKTIEACLILHRLHLIGRAARVLILVPEPLVNQWFVELLRRFNLRFAIFDEERCASLEAHDEGNPFLDSQLILAPITFVSNSPRRTLQVVDAGFDLLVVDEAHHLTWTPESASPEYLLVENLSRVTPSVLLLTATPQQLGIAGHFARLRLLDPVRYNDLNDFIKECRNYPQLAGIIDALAQGLVPRETEEWFLRSPQAGMHYAALLAGDQAARIPLIKCLIDAFGTGRVLFRNTRNHLGGFPQRQPHLHPLPDHISPDEWLADFLSTLPYHEKVLLITSSPESAISIREALLARIQVDSALFHENLNLLQRDRNAAWFAEADGARILICSEIGSEGRNFQFARHLVLLDLPRHPELLEQRIGRLDRIGQAGTIDIYIIYQTNRRAELQALWLHEGLQAFSEPLKGADTLAGTLLPELDHFESGSARSAGFQAFIQRSRALKDQIARELANGQDRLLELAAPDPTEVANMIDTIGESARNLEFDRFTVRLFDHLGLDADELSRRTYHFHRGQRHSENFAELPPEGFSGTFSRPTALAREDLELLSLDHPLVLGAIDQLIASDTGSTSFARWRTGQGKMMLLECAFILEVLAPGHLHLDRFLPPTLIRVTVDHTGNPVPAPPRALLFQDDPRPLVTQSDFRHRIFPRMLASAQSLANDSSIPLVRSARQTAEDMLHAEIARLEDLSMRNPAIPTNELNALRIHRSQVLDALLASPHVRLDALRLVWRS